MGQVRRIIDPNEPRRPVQQILTSDAGFRKGIRIQHGLIYEEVE